MSNPFHKIVYIIPLSCIKPLFLKKKAQAISNIVTIYARNIIKIHS